MSDLPKYFTVLFLAASVLWSFQVYWFCCFEYSLFVVIVIERN